MEAQIQVQKNASQRIPVAVLGATGAVGQKAIAMLASHSKLTVGELVASQKRIGTTLKDLPWIEALPMPTSLANQKFSSISDIQSKYVLSALPADEAKTIELELADRGHVVVSNASAFRMNANVPLLIPEINSTHLELLEKQDTTGKIITNPNCSTVFLSLALAPLLEAGEPEIINVTTLQAISGAGYPGLASMDILGNCIPYIMGEEEKMLTETCKILGKVEEPRKLPLCVSCNRVPVLHGHLINIQYVFQKKSIQIENVMSQFHTWNERFPNIFKIYTEDDRPQPRKDLQADDQRVHVGRIRWDGSRKTLQLVALGHNLVRGAAGAAIKNIETITKSLGE